MYLEKLSLTDFRSYPQVDLELAPGVTVFVGSNGLGKTNLIEALGYLSSLASHRVSQDGPLIRFGAERAIIRGALVRAQQRLSLEVEINAGRANRARINRANPVRARDILGLCRTVLFAPEDLALVKGDPGNRRRFLDDLLQLLHPRFAGLRADYDRVLKQRNALLKSARSHGGFRKQATPEFVSTIEVWDQHLAAAAAQLLAARLELLAGLRGPLAEAYAQLTDGSKGLTAKYRSNLTGYEEDNDSTPTEATEAEGLAELSELELTDRYLNALSAARSREMDRGITLIGPHRDELELQLGDAPARGYASHGETWSVALALRLASYRVLRDDAEQGVLGSDPILILDDVFAELDVARRTKLAKMVASAEQVLVTAAVEDDIPAELSGQRIRVISAGVIDGQ
ncbi:DNA replication/repair protein RecF [Psychromicrobium lacuslunae]|uniref:DNA replication and repair protein RecF n=1 Tax=Psychromicrobium lacuslunae TaxID=1618207 RepID=A0A0D4C0Y1_9MICC|nr:DNA replication/repair protein RecF [Psychromicrobium lacuslunae]AJT42253.1 recombinase RecF [Psychromicrobium lacuslunae]